MKKPLLISAALILCTTLMAQVPQGISHQAVIRNTQGELVTGQTIGVRVSILQGSAEGVAVFVETHQPLSNENGLITYVIGEGTPTLGFLDDIDWTSGPYFLKTEADPAGGSNYTITGTTQFLSVPYALHAGTSEDNHWEYSETNIFTRNTGNVGIGTQTPFSLLHTLGNGTGEGNVLFEGLYKTPANQGDPPVTGPGTRMMWYPDKAAFRVGRVLDDEWDKNNIGVYSIAMGYNTKATGMGSVALGYEANATSDYAISLGFETNTAFPRSVAIGNNTRAGSPFEIVVGRYNTPYIPSSFFGWHSNDRLFVIGNGTSQENRSNAVTVLKSGNFGIGTSTPEAQFHTTGSVRFAGAGTPGTGKVLTSNEDGTATWQEFTNSSNWTVSGSGIYRLEGNVGIGVENPEGKLHVSAPGEWLGVSFSGTGLDDLVVDISGYNGTGATAYAVRIENIGPVPNLIETSNDGGTTWSYPVPISPDIDMGYGVIINFGSTSGYTYNDRWDWTVNESFEDMLLVKDGRVGIGTQNPEAQLHTTGSVRFEGAGTPGAGKVLTSDGEGLGTWQDKGFDLPYSGTYFNDEEAVFQVTNTAPSVNSSGLYGIGGFYGTGVIGSGFTGVKGLGTTGVYGETTNEDGYGVHGRVYDLGTGQPYGVFGESLSEYGAGVGGSGPIGVQGVGASRGVFGYNFSESDYEVTYGVYGHSSGENGHGVFGWANSHYGNTYGGYFQSSSSQGTGVFGLATRNNGNTYGGYFQSNSSQGTGVYGLATDTSSDLTYGGYFVSSSTAGIGVYAESIANTTNPLAGTFGVFARTYALTGPATGVYGLSTSNSGNGVYGWANASTGTTYGVYGVSSSNSGRGVYGWAIANSGTTYGVYGSCESPDGYGVFSAGRFAATGTKSFQIDHPLDPANKYLNHFCSEGPEPLNVYSGNIITDAKGFATVNLPEYFESINRDFRYQLTIIDDSDEFVLAKVTREVQNNRFIIRTSKPNVKVSWRVEGVRNDNWVKQHGALAEKEKPAEHRGKYLNPEFFGMPKDMGIHFQEDIERPEFLQLQECEKAEPQGIDHQMNQ